MRLGVDRYFGSGFGVGEFLDWGEVTDEGEGCDVFDEFGGGLKFFLPGEVGAGDLEAVEEDGGPFVIDVAGGDAGEDVVQGDLDTVAVVDGLHFEDADSTSERRVGETGAVMVVAEVLTPESGRSAAASSGVDVAAEIAAVPSLVGGGACVVVHGV